MVLASSHYGHKTRTWLAATAPCKDQCIEGTEERIRKMLKSTNTVKLSVSSYDTAWVAMIPSPNTSNSPCFPECLDWLLENQQGNGSWGPSNHSHLLLKDSLSSTLASVLALKRWNLGQSHINKGIQFIEWNFQSAIDKNQHSPIGFDIIFPGMLDYTKDLDLKLCLEPIHLNAMLHARDLELQRCYESKADAYLAYMSEGMGKFQQDWEGIKKKYQRKNGSFFNSPATTAALLTHHLPDEASLNYIRLLLDRYGNAVPTLYPVDIYVRLSMIDNLQQLGIDWHFSDEIQSVLDQTYRCWLQKDEQIFTDVSTCAIAFRLLRMNGYEVSSDPLTQIVEEGNYVNSPYNQNLKGISDALELYKASQIIISPDESSVLRTQNLQSSDFLKQISSDDSFCSDKLSRSIRQEVDDALSFPLCASLERMTNRRCIEQYNVDTSSIRVLKTSYFSSNIGNKDFLLLAVEDFNQCQSRHREEAEYLARWVIENKLDKLKFVRQKSFSYGSFSASATSFTPKLSHARMSWAKNAILTTVVDDFFDIAGSIDELLNLIYLVDKWDNVDIETDCYSEQVGIIFSALKRGINEIAEQAFMYQARNVTSHIVQIWLDLLKSMLREFEWSRDKYIPSMKEYMENGYISFALGPIVLPALYLIGPKISEEAAHSSQVNNLFRLMSNCGRLLNDIQSFKRESKEGKLNAVSLRIMMMMNEGEIDEGKIVNELKMLVESYKNELLRIVVKEKESVLPRECKDLFWKMTKVVHQFYHKDDGFTSQHMMKAVNDVIYQPVILEESLIESIDHL